MIANLALTLLLAATPEPPAAPTEDLVQLEERVQEVRDRVIGATVGLRSRSGHASGVIVSEDGYILTVAHALDRPHRRVTVTLADGTRLRGETLGKNETRDFGLVKIVSEDADFDWVEMGRSEDLRREEPCLATGHPGAIYSDRGPVLRFGTVSRWNDNWLRTSCVIMPGDSGGPVFNLDGEVIGISSWIDRSLSGNFHVPVDRFRESWDRLVAGEVWEPESRRSSMRRDVPPPREAERLGVMVEDTTDGVRIVSVREGFPAQGAGLCVDDVVLSVAGRRVASTRELERSLRRLFNADTYKLRIARGGEELQLTIDSAWMPEGSLALLRRGKLSLRAASYAVADPFEESVVTVLSRRRGRRSSIRGVVVDAAGLILTKSSEVHDEPRVVHLDGTQLAALVLARDDERDLALLEVERDDLRPVSWSAEADPDRGRFLVSVLPGRATHEIGVVGNAARPVRGSRRAYLGVRLAEDAGEGAIVESVEEGTAAEAAGLSAADRIIQIDSTPVRSRDQLIRGIGSLSPGDVVVLTVVRAEAQVELDATLGRRPTFESRFDEDHVADSTDISSRRNGFPLAVQHDGDVHPSECGGLVVDLQGRAVGINIARADRPGTLMLPASEVLAGLEELRGASR